MSVLILVLKRFQSQKSVHPFDSAVARDDTHGTGTIVDPKAFTNLGVPPAGFEPAT